MEVLLNTIWLLVAIGAFLFWRPERYRGTPTARDHDRSFGILALACALVLLFPVISLTDDLHAEQVRHGRFIPHGDESPESGARMPARRQLSVYGSRDHCPLFGRSSAFVLGFGRRWLKYVFSALL